MAFVSASVVFGYDELENGSYLPLVLLMMLIFGWRQIMMGYFDKAMKFKVKRLIRGVITSKQSLNKKGCFVEFSMKLIIQMMPGDYKILVLGDIVRMEMLSDDVYMKRKVIVEGKI